MWPVISRGKPQQLIWASLMSPNVFVKPLKCWNKNLCVRQDRKKVDRSQCCSEISPKFKKMESDMHNIFPMIAEPVSPSETNNFSGLWEYRYCKKKARLGKRLAAMHLGRIYICRFNTKFIWKKAWKTH